MSWEGEGTFPQRKATFVLDVVWDVAFDEGGGMILEIDEAVYSGGMLRGPACFRRFYRKSGAFFSSRKRRHADSRAGAWGPGQPFPDRTRAAPRSPQRSGESSRLSVARGGPKGHDGIAARRAAHSGVQVPHPAAANDEEAA